MGRVICIVPENFVDFFYGRFGPIIASDAVPIGN